MQQQIFKQKIFKFKPRAIQDRPQSPSIGNRQSISQYLTVHARAKKYLSPHQKEMVQLQFQENRKLMRRLSSINSRKNQFIARDQDQQKLRGLALASKQLQRIKKEQQLQNENDYLIEKITKARTQQNSQLELPSSQQRVRRRNQSVLLPAINPDQE